MSCTPPCLPFPHALSFLSSSSFCKRSICKVVTMLSNFSYLIFFFSYLIFIIAYLIFIIALREMYFTAPFFRWGSWTGRRKQSIQGGATRDSRSWNLTEMEQIPVSILPAFAIKHLSGLSEIIWLSQMLGLGTGLAQSHGRWKVLIFVLNQLWFWWSSRRLSWLLGCL